MVAHRSAGEFGRRPSGPPHARGGAGVGIILLLVVLLIGLLIYFVQAGSGGNYARQLSETRRSGVEVKREINTSQLTLLITMFRDQNNRLPKDAEEMDAAAAFRDEWGNPITFTFRPSPGGTTVTYHSNGPDGEPNTGDDLTRDDRLAY